MKLTQLHKSHLKQIFILIILVALLILPYFVFAEHEAQKMLRDAGETGAGYAKYEENTFEEVLGSVVAAFLSLLGVIFIILMLYGGYHWMTAAGDEQKVTKAKDTIRRAIIGLLIVVSAYAIWYFIYDLVIHPT